MNTLIHKTDHLKNYSSLAHFFDLEEFEILTEVLKVSTYQKGQMIYLSPDCPVLIVSNQSVTNSEQAKAAFRLEQPAGEKDLSFTAEADGIYFTLEKHKMQLLLEEHLFLALKLNQIVDTRLTALL